MTDPAFLSDADGAASTDAAPTMFAELTTIRTGGRPLVLLAPQT